MAQFGAPSASSPARRAVAATPAFAIDEMVFRLGRSQRDGAGVGDDQMTSPTPIRRQKGR